MYYSDKGHVVVRKNTVELIQTEEAEDYFGKEDYRQYWDDYDITEEDVTEWHVFLKEFEIVGSGFLVNQDFYYGQNYMFVARRKSDGKDFGIQYFHGGGKYGESMFQDALNDDYETYSFKPVETFTILGYRYKEEQC